MRFRGAPYLWGGCTALGIDCSGFVQLVWRLHGIGLPRDAHQQVECGADVPLSAARAGDLLFFRTDGSSRVAHVAICMEGEQIVHAKGGDGVRMDARAEEPYARLAVAARRLTACVTRAREVSVGSRWG